MSSLIRLRPQCNALLFGRFELQRDRRFLLLDGRPIKIGGRAFDLLEIFADRAGETIAKEELIARVWPNIFVHDTNLKVTISSLRRILGDTAPHSAYIATIPGRGYRFIAEVVRESGAAVARLSSAAPSDSARLPEVGEIIGREGEIAEVLGRLGQSRIVSLVGPGGVGKTTVAIAAARQILHVFPDGVCFVDFSAIEADQLVPSIVASALGVRGNPTDVTLAIAESLVSRRKLIILDNCEHVVHSVRAIVSRICASGAGSRILLTSRERIGAVEEALVQIHPLPFPDGGVAQTPEDALSYPSVELFVTRALEWTEFEFLPEQAGVVAAICRSLDGLPLALEIAAGQLDRHGPDELLAMLDEHLAAFGNRNAEAPSRQKTLWAALDWSYQLLSADEAQIFRFLSVFAGVFDLEDVLAVLAPLGMDAYRVTTGLGGLVGKSLVVAQADDLVLRYRLLDSARIYAAEQFRHDDHLDAVWASYTLHLAALFEKAEEEWIWREAIEWRSQYRPRLNDLRQALDWCFGRGGRPELGFRLTTSALLLWDEVSSVAEARARIDQALAYTGTVDGDAKALAKLARSRAWHLLNVKPIPPESVEAWEVAICHAQRSADIESYLRALWGFALYRCQTGHYAKALDLLERFRDLAILNDEWTALPDGDWLYAMVEVHLARLTRARARLEKLAKENPLVGHRTRVARFVVDRSMMLRTQLSFTLWVSGQPERAQRIADEVSEFDEDAQHLVSQICHLSWSRLPIALWNSDLPAFSRLTAKMRSHLEIENIPVWHPVRDFHQAVVDYHRGDEDAVWSMRKAIDEIIASNHIIRAPICLGVLAEALLKEGRLGDARATLDEALSFADRQKETWSNPELLRISAGISLAGGEQLAALAMLQDAKTLALNTGALFFALRSANDLAELYLADRQPQSAVDVLQPVYARYTEGFDTYDLVRASRILERAGVTNGRRLVCAE